MSHFKSALVLSGGSARALSHLGVLQEIERTGMKVDLIVGSSMGAVIGGLYAFFRDEGLVMERLRGLFSSDLFLKTAAAAVEDNHGQISPDGFFNRFMTLFRKGVYYTHSVLKSELVPDALYEEIMGALVPEVLIEDLPIPFAAVAMDIITGEEVVITHGPLRRAVAASSAIPGMFPVIDFSGRLLIDGGWADNVPVAPALALGAHFVLAVDATLEIGGMASAYPQSAIEMIFRCNEITRILLTRRLKAYADAIIEPDVGHMYWADFRAIEECAAAGRKAFAENETHIRQQMMARRLRTFGGAVHPGRSGDWRHPFTIV